MATFEKLCCSNPFFSCLNTKKELKISVDIQVKGEKYPICDCCWPTIAESEEYQWSQPTALFPDLELQFEPNFNSATAEMAEEE